ncbi:FecR domain-containing protein [Bacteroidota bacterium]
MKRPGSTVWETAENGTTLTTGTRIQLASSSNAILTFFNGTTVELEPGADLVVEQLEVGSQNQPTVIVLRQWFGKTWSRVAQLADPGSRYEIQTPSATIMVRGTVFTTEVDDTGTARVQTIEGLVSVSAQGEEVYLPAGQQTEVKSGASPLEPVPISAANDRWSPAQSQEKPPMQGSHNGEPQDDGQPEPPEMSADTDSLPGTADSSVATQHDTLTEAPQEQNIETLPAQTSNSKDTPSQSQEGLPSYGKDAGQDQSNKESDLSGQSQRKLWIPVISSVVLLLWIGVFITMERRKSTRAKHQRNKFSSTRFDR